MTPQISLIIPSIRPSMWQQVYDSFLTTWSGTFEIIFVGPFGPETNLDMNTIARGEIRVIEDYGCPSRALQIGWINAKAPILSFATDDCIFDQGTMDKAWRTLDYHWFDYKTVIVCKYTESDNWSKWMMTPWYYHAWYHADFHHFNIPFHFKLFMNGLISKEIMIEVGGFDTKYESMAYTYNSLSMRLQFHGCKFIIEKNRLDHCSWQDGNSSDHGPVAKVCIEHDMPLFRGEFWAKKFTPKIVIPVDNWKQSPKYWPRRFPQD